MCKVICKYESCMTKTSYPNGRCKKHGGTYDILTNIQSINTDALPLNPTCSVINCNKYISINSKTGKCAHHNKYCINCINWIDARIANKKFNGYCATCFKHCFPTDPLSTTIRAKGVELQVRDFINQRFQGFVHDRPVYSHNCDCPNRRRLDHHLLLGNTILAIETDEFQHRYYNSEEIRYNDLFMHFSGKWIIIRINTNSYFDSNGKYRLTKLHNRLDKLSQEIQKQIERIELDCNTEPLEVIKLFYDDFTYPRYEYTYDGERHVKTLMSDE